MWSFLVYLSDNLVNKQHNNEDIKKEKSYEKFVKMTIEHIIKQIFRSNIFLHIL